MGRYAGEEYASVPTCRGAVRTLQIFDPSKLGDGA